MKSLWRHYDVIFEKLVKRQSSSAKIHIFSIIHKIQLVSQIILFLVHTLLIAHFSKFVSKKQNIWKIAEKWDLICQKN